jgi:hypothetical protein
LEFQSAGFDALNDIIPFNGRFFGVADGMVDAFDAFVGDCRDVPVVLGDLN